MYDSISGYDTSAELYSVRWNPQQQRAYAETAPSPGKDRLETPKERMERQAPLKTATKGGHLAEEREVVVGRAGRYVFLALVTPPYFLLFTAPKWIGSAVIPSLLRLAELGFENAKRFFAEMARLFSERVASPFRDLSGRIKWLAARLMEKNFALMAFLKEKGSRLFRRASAPFVRAGRRVEELKRRLEEAGRRFNKKVLKKAVQFLEREVAEFYRELKALFAPSADALKRRFKKGESYAVRHITDLAEKFGKALFRLKQRLRPPLEEAIRLLAAFEAWSGRKLEKITAPIVRFVVPRIKKIQKGLDWASQKRRQLLLKGHFQVQRLLAKADVLLTTAARKWGNFLKKWGGRLAEALDRLFKKLPFLQPLSRGVVLLCKKGGARLQTVWNLFARLYKSAGKKISSALLRIKGKLQKWSAPRFTAATAFTCRLREACRRKLSYVCRYLKAGIKISCK